jgi:hypothetical protein
VTPAPDELALASSTCHASGPTIWRTATPLLLCSSQPLRCANPIPGTRRQGPATHDVATTCRACRLGAALSPHCRVDPPLHVRPATAWPPLRRIPTSSLPDNPHVTWARHRVPPTLTLAAAMHVVRPAVVACVCTSQHSLRGNVRIHPLSSSATPMFHAHPNLCFAPLRLPIKGRVLNLLSASSPTHFFSGKPRHRST